VPAEKRTPLCKVSVGGSPLATNDQARLVRANVELDADLLAQTTLLFMDPEMELINGSVFESGKSVELKLGYDANATSVFFGEVVRLEPQFRRDEPVALKVVCQDSLHRLALTPMTRTFNDADLSTVVTSIAQEHGLSADAPSGTKQFVLQNNVTDAEFLKRFAMRMGLRLFLDGKKLTMGPLPNTDPIPLALGDGVKKLKVKRSAKGQVSEISVHGWDEKAKQELVGKAQPQGATGKGATDYGAGTLSDSSGDLLPPDVSTAEGIAKGRMKKIAEGYATLEAELIGDSRFLPGQVVELDKLGAGTDGSYRIDRAEHLFSKHGYYVRFDAVWQGPKTSPAAPKPQTQPYTPPKPVEKGKLTRPRWKRRSSGGSDVADMNVDAGKALEGKSVTFVLETKVSGDWKEVARANGSVSNGFANATANLTATPPADVISAPKWTTAKDNKHENGQTAEVSVDTKVQKPHDIRLILEQQLMGGRLWQAVDSKMVKASGGTVKTTFDLEHPHSQQAGQAHSEVIKKPVWSQKPGGKGAPGLVTAETPGMEDGRKVRFIAERLGRDGKWGAIKTLEATVQKGSASATVDLEHTIEKPQPAPAKQLSAPKWEKSNLAHGDLGKLTVDAPKLDGQRVRFVVEQNEGGNWKQVGERVVNVASGKAETQMPLKHPAGKDQVKKLPDAKHDPKTGTATLTAAAYEGRQVRLIAEKKSGSGWTQVSAKTVTVKGGAVSAQITAPLNDSRLTKPTWGADAVQHGGEVQVSVDARGLDGATVEFVLERLDGKQWGAVGTVRAKVVKGKATASMKVKHPAVGKPGAQDLGLRRLRFQAKLVSADTVRVRAELMPDSTPRNLRFRAEVVPDVGAQKIRFRAEPIPDLRPRKLRFRAELPVPEHPGLTRMRVELQGGTPDDHVHTGGSSGD